MASAAVTLSGDDAFEFECDGTERVATLRKPGGYVRNTHATEKAYINTGGGTVVTTQPVGEGCATIKPGEAYPLPDTCRSFSFKAAASTYLQYSRNQPT